MKNSILCIGKTTSPFLKEGVNHYLNRLRYYSKVDYIELPDVSTKGLSQDQLKEREGELFLRHIKPEDTLILLDEKGNEWSSVEFAGWLQQKMNASAKHIVFVIGGAFGFSDEVYHRTSHRLSFSKMTFSHEMIRLILAEQLYRAHTILKNEKYHHV